MSKKHINEKHGMCQTQFYRKWSDMGTRCNNKKYIGYHNYGGRGISVEWKSFDEFKNDMYMSYLKHVAIHGERNTTLDRVDVNGNYSKNNCRWATFNEQFNNTRENIVVFHNGEKMSLTEFCRKWNLKFSRTYKCHTQGATVEELLLPFRKFQPNQKNKP